MLIDTHAHVNFKEFKDDGNKVIKQSLAQGIWLINVGAQYSTSQRAIEYAEKYEQGVYAAVGLHPSHVSINNKKKTMQDCENKTRILIVDADVAVRQGLMHLVNDQASFTVGFEAKSANQALETVEKQQIDLAIVSSSVEGKNRTQPAEKIRLQHPNLPVLMLSRRGDI